MGRCTNPSGDGDTEPFAEETVSQEGVSCDCAGSSP